MRALWARSHTREPTRAATIIEEWRLAQEKMVGTYHVWQLGRDERDATTLGPLFSQSGVHLGVHWQQTRNGLTFTTTGLHELRDELSERAWESGTDPHDVRLIGESVPLNAYVVELDPPGGRHEWRFIEKNSGNVVRLEEVAKGRRFVTNYDDFRIFDGIAEPSRVRTSDSLGNDRDQVLLSRTLDLTPDPKDVDVPPNRRTFVEFPFGIPSVRLPVRIVDGLPVVRVHVGLHVYDFLLDSGAAGIIVDPSVIDDQHLDTYGSRIGATVGTFSETTSIVPLLQVGGLKMHAAVVRVVAVPFHLDPVTRISGLLGFDFFADCIVHVDLDHAIVDAFAPGTFRPPPDAVTVPLALDDRTPVVRAKIDAAYGRVVADTGANRSIFGTGFADRADIAPDALSGASRFSAVGGTGTGEPVHLKTFDLAGLPVADPIVDVTGDDTGIEDLDGTAGTDLLHAYDLYFDYRSQLLYVRRTHHLVGPP